MTGLMDKFGLAFGVGQHSYIALGVSFMSLLMTELTRFWGA